MHGSRSVERASTGRYLRSARCAAAICSSRRHGPNKPAQLGSGRRSRLRMRRKGRAITVGRSSINVSPRSVEPAKKVPKSGVPGDATASQAGVLATIRGVMPKVSCRTMPSDSAFGETLPRPFTGRPALAAAPRDRLGQGSERTSRYSARRRAIAPNNWQPRSETRRC
jgi:hypothetical protein